MISPPPFSATEAARIAALRDYDILDSAAEAAFDRLVRLAAASFGAPISAISLVDSDRQWFKAKVGLDLDETSRELSFCAHTIRQRGPLVVSDATQDARFAGHPFVLGDPGIRFYVGMPLIDRAGHALGSLCVLDRRPRQASPAELEVLEHLAALAMDLIEQRRLIQRQRQAEEERFRAEAALRQAEARLEAAARAGRIGVWDWDLRTNRVSWSSVHAELWDMAPGAFGGTMQDFDSRLHPDDRNEVWNAVRDALARRTEYDHEYRIVRSDGGIRWILGRGRGEYDARGQAVRMSGIVTDITEKKSSQLALAQLLEEAEFRRQSAAASEERYRMLFDNHPQPLWVYDVDTLEFLAVNDATVQQYGFSREEFSRMTIKEIRPTEDVPALLASVTGGPIRAGVSQTGEWRHRRKDGSIMVVEISSHALSFDGRPARIVLALDVTEKKSLQDQFLRAQRMENLGLLAAGVAHDLNNILTPLMMVAPLLGRRLTGEADQRLLATIEQSVRRGAGLVKQILAFSRGSGSELGPLQIKHVARDIAGMIAETFPRSIRFEPDIGADLWSAHANPTQVHQVLLNLCVNARDAMPEGGELRLRVANCTIDEDAAAAIPAGRPGRFVLVEVGDTGCGIPPEIADRIWQPFFTTKPEGTGLGLATVRGIVTRHRGLLAVESAPARGTTFRVYLPAEADSGSAPEQSEAPGTETPLGAGECILFVDDEPDIRTSAQATLARHGYHCLIARDAYEALELLAQRGGGVRLVVTDHHMPGMDGQELMQRIRSQYPGLPALLCSGSVGRTVPGFAPQQMLLKPFEPTTLLSAVRRILRG